VAETETPSGPAPQHGPIGLQRKLSAKTITGLNADAIAKIGRGGKTALFHIIGSAGDSKTIETQYGPSTGLFGTFEAVNADTGESFYSGVAYLPPHVTNMILGQMRKSQGAVEFALTVGVQPDDSRFGYAYYAETHVDPRTDERMSTLRKLLPPARKMIAATAATPKKS
jgi:hypothetical protein